MCDHLCLLLVSNHSTAAGWKFLIGGFCLNPVVTVVARNTATSDPPMHYHTCVTASVVHE